MTLALALDQKASAFAFDDTALLHQASQRDAAFALQIEDMARRLRNFDSKPARRREMTKQFTEFKEMLERFERLSSESSGCASTGGGLNPASASAKVSNVLEINWTSKRKRMFLAMSLTRRWVKEALVISFKPNLVEMTWR